MLKFLWNIRSVPRGGAIEAQRAEFSVESHSNQKTIFILQEKLIGLMVYSFKFIHVKDWYLVCK